MLGFCRQTELPSDAVARAKRTMAKPGYLAPVRDPITDVMITRISGNPGVSIPNIAGGVWGSCPRHHYNLDQSWNADQSQLIIDVNVDPDGIVTGGTDALIFLNGQTYAPIRTRSYPGDYRWHPTDPALIYSVSGNLFRTWNPTTNAFTTVRTFTGYSNLTFGNYKGICSNDGDYHIFHGSNGSQTVAFAYRRSTDTKYADITVSGLENAQVSPLGTYVFLLNGNDDMFVYTLTGTLVQTWTANPVGAGTPSHADLAINALGQEVAVGTGKSNTYDGRQVAKRMSNGTEIALTAASPKQYSEHTSARCISKPGWAFASYSTNNASYPLYAEAIAAMKLDGSKSFLVCHTHATNTQDNYYSQSQVSASPTGDRLIFASNWDDPNGNGRPVQAYVVDLRDRTGLV